MLQGSLKEFAEAKDVISYHDFSSIENYDRLKEFWQNFEPAFDYATDAVQNTKGKILFRLDDVDLSTVANIKPETILMEELPELGGHSLWLKGKITEWELSRIVNEKALLKITEFYRDGVKISTKEVLKMIKSYK